MLPAKQKFGGASVLPASRATRRWSIVSYDAFGYIVALSDTLVIMASSVACGVVYHRIAYGEDGAPRLYLGFAILLCAVFVPLLQARSAYEASSFENRSNHLGIVITSWALTFFLLAIVAFSLRVGGDLSRASVFASAVVGGLGVIVHHSIWISRLRASSSLNGELFRERKAVLLWDFEFLDRDDVRIQLSKFGINSVLEIMLPHDLAECGDDQITRIKAATRGDGAVEIFVICDFHRLERMRSLLVLARSLPFPVKVIPNKSSSALICKPMQRLGEWVTIEFQSAPLSSWERLQKRGLDIAIASIALLVFLPILAAAAVAVRLDSPGPVFFRQRRLGFNDVPFQIWKFRTMKVHDDPVVKQAVRGDDRVTSVGYWLRRSSVDELPQLLNVLMGNMSLVGPRPHAVAHDDFYGELIKDYAFRHHVKPGLTGLAQVRGLRGEVTSLDAMKRRVEADLCYIDNWSIWLDLSILARTVTCVLSAKNAF